MMDDQVNMDLEITNLNEVKNVLTQQNLELQTELEGCIQVDDQVKDQLKKKKSITEIREKLEHELNDLASIQQMRKMELYERMR